MQFTWTAPAVGVASSYVIEAGSSPGLANLASINTGNSSTSYSTSGVGNGSYYVRVRASDGTTVSPPSNEVLVVVGNPCGAPPSTPSGLAFVVGGTTVVLNWITVSGATSYILEAGSNARSSNLAVIDTGNSTPSFTAVNVGTGFYYVRARAKNACGASGASNEVVFYVF